MAVSKEGKDVLVIQAFEWTHRHFPNLMDCRPIYGRRALEATGLVIEDSLTQSMWVPVEIVRGQKAKLAVWSVVRQVLPESHPP